MTTGAARAQGIARGPCVSDPLGIILDESALESLSDLRESRFAHAYLIALVAQSRSDCLLADSARQAVRPSPRRVPLPSADGLIEALREERRQHERQQQFLTSLREGNIDDVLVQVLTPLRETWEESARGLLERRADIESLELSIAFLNVEGSDLEGGVAALKRAAEWAEEWQEWDDCVTEPRARIARIENDLRDLRGADKKRKRQLQQALGAAREDLATCPTEPRHPVGSPQELGARIRAAYQELGPSYDEAFHLVPGTAGLDGIGAGTSLRVGPATEGLQSLRSADKVQSLSDDVPLGSLGTTANLFAALTDYTVERIRDELVLTYLRRVQSHLDAATWSEDVFPETLYLVGLLESASVDEFGLQAWRSAFVSDLQRLPQNVLGSQDLSDSVLGCREGTPAAPLDSAMNQRLSACRALGRVRLGLDLADHLRDGARPLDLLADLGEAIDLTRLAPGDPLHGPLGYGVGVASRIASDIRLQDIDVSGGTLPPYIVAPRTIRQASPEHRRAYVRLLTDDMTVDGLLSNTATLDAMSESVAQAVGLAADLISGAERLSEQAATLPRAARAQAARELVLMGLSVPLALSPLAPSRQATDQIQRDLDTLEARWRQGVEILALLDEGSASAALTRTLTLYRAITDRPLPISSDLLNVMSLSASLAEAQTSEEMVQAFRATALPSGSYRARREGRGARVALNLYPGLVYGREEIVDVDGAEGWEQAGGVTLPVGVNVALGRTPTLASLPSGWSWLAPPLTISAFASVIDLGALLAYRLSGTGDQETDDGMADGDVTVSALPDVSFREVFAPGGAIVLGLGRSPFVVSFGVQFMPELRSIEIDGVETADGSVVRYSVGLGLDLPLLNLSGR